MFRIQSELLQGLPWEVFQALTGCGPIYRDVLQGPFEIVGAPLENADPAQHAIFKVTNQGNLNIPVAIFGGNVGVTGTLNVTNITVDGQDGYTTTVTLNHLTCNEGGIQVTPYTFTFERGVLVDVTIGGTEPFGCQAQPGFIRGILLSSLEAGGTATLQTAVNEEEYTVHDYFLESGYKIDSGTRVGASLDPEDGNYYVTEMRGCPTEV